MEKIIIGIERNIPYDFNGRQGVTNRFYLMDCDDQSFSRDNGSSFIGRHAEFVKVPKSVKLDDFGLGDKINVFYNRYGQIEEIQKVK